MHNTLTIAHMHSISPIKFSHTFSVNSAHQQKMDKRNELAGWLESDWVTECASSKQIKIARSLMSSKIQWRGRQVVYRLKNVWEWLKVTQVASGWALPYLAASCYNNIIVLLTTWCLSLQALIYHAPLLADVSCSLRRACERAASRRMRWRVQDELENWSVHVWHV